METPEDALSSRLRILTVGDGDLTLSLAIVRCYGVENVELTASCVVPSREKLISTYPITAGNSLHELESQYRATVLFGVDACYLHDRFHRQNKGQSVKPFDIVVFQHPHLGDYDADEMDLLQRHCILIAHYLDSARRVSDRIHVALCANQAESWCLLQSAARVGLSLHAKVPVQNPFHHIFPEGRRYPWTDSPNWQPNYQGNEKRIRQEVSRHGGSRNWMGRFGYHHVRTMPKKRSYSAPMLARSFHYIFQENVNSDAPLTTLHSVPGDLDVVWTCQVCDVAFRTVDDLQNHVGTSFPSQSENAQLGYATDIPDSNIAFSTTSTLEASEKIVESKNIETGMLKRGSDDKNMDTTVWVVSSENAGKRLRWYVTNVVGGSPSMKKSKREWEQYIKDGFVEINDVVVTDSSRILQSSGWKVALRVDDKSKTKNSGLSSSVPSLQIVDTWKSSVGDFFFINKPVGMRAIGSFDASTLEEVFSSQQREQAGTTDIYRCLSKLDKFCGGLVLVQSCSDSRTWPVNTFEICHTFCALVHGHVLEEWNSGIEIRLPLNGIRRWKKPAGGPSNVDANIPIEECTVRIVCTERTVGDHVPALSTLHISTKSQSSRLAQVVCYFIRKTMGHPVVGDRIAVDEYFSLPRSVRNRIKQRLCFGCVQNSLVVVNTGEQFEASIPVPNRWSARYWKSFCSNPNSLSSSTVDDEPKVPADKLNH